MHIAEGVLSAPVLLGGGVLACAGIALGLHGITSRKISLCGVMAAVFFIGSLIHVPVGFASVHLLFCGLIGALLGWGAFPAIFTALLFQAVLFQFGGLSVLGVNTFCMGLAAVGAWYVFRLSIHFFKTPFGIALSGFFAGACGTIFSALLTASALAFSSEGFRAAAIALLVAHLPVMAIEGIITAATTGFIARAKPELLSISMK